MHRFLNTTTRNALWFKRAADNGELEMRPPFQRNLVWTDKQKSFLVDTILREYPIPELYVQELITPTGEQKHIVVDGQQRLAALLGFISGEFELNREDSPEWAEMKFDDLAAQDKKKIYEYSFVVRVLPEASEDQLRDIFTRLNRSTSVLNAQELRQATYWGPFIGLMNSLAEAEFWSTVRLFSSNDVRRKLDIEFISELTVAVLHGPQDKKKSLEQWYAAYENKFEHKARVEQLFAFLTGELTQILPELWRTRWRKKSDFYTLFCVLAKYGGQLPFSSDRRQIAREQLTTFAERVDRVLANPSQPEDPLILTYAQAVQRAASDLSNRVRRQQALEEYLAKILPLEHATAFDDAGSDNGDDE